MMSEQPRPVTRPKWIRWMLSVLLTLLGLMSSLPTAFAANGDFVQEVAFSQNCRSGIGVGIAYDGAGHLWISCYASNPDLMRASATTGVVDKTYNIASDLGAIAYDAGRNGIWAAEAGAVYFIQLDASQNVVSHTIAFSAGSDAAGLVDGLAFDSVDQTLYFKPDNSSPIHHYTTAGVKLADITGASSCYGPATSGLAIGGQYLYEGKDGCSHVYVVDKTTLAPFFDFSTVIASDPNHRDEGLTCDTQTFAGKGIHVMWSKEAYNPNRAAAFEIPFGTCGSGGKKFVPDTTPPSCALTAVGTNAKGQKYIQVTVQDSDGGMQSVTVSELSNAVADVGTYQTGISSAPTMVNTGGTTSPIVVTATKQNQSLGASIGLHLVDVAGNVTNCDPVLTSLSAQKGKAGWQVYPNVPSAEHVVRVTNGDPGLNRLVVVVNSQAFSLNHLQAGEVRTLDIAKAMQPGKANTIVLRGYGKTGASAEVLIWDGSGMPPAGSSLADPNSHQDQVQADSLSSDTTANALVDWTNGNASQHDGGTSGGTGGDGGS